MYRMIITELLESILTYFIGFFNRSAFKKIPDKTGAF